MQTHVLQHDIVGTLEANGSFNILVRCIRAADMVKYLGDTDRTYTLFAPNESAFKKLVAGGDLKALLDDKERVRHMVRYHIIPRRRIPQNHIDGSDVLRSLSGEELLITVNSGFAVNNVPVVRPNIEASNGIIHEIGAVLTPSTSRNLLGIND